MAHYPEVRPRATSERHAELLVGTPSVTSRSLGAIVVSASRPAGHLAAPFELARAVNCPAVVLSSGATSVAETLAQASRFPELGAVVIPVGPDDGQQICPLTTDAWGTGTAGLGDLSVKRNLGLLLARLSGWETVFFLDDDIEGLAPTDVDRAMAVLPDEGMAGMPARYFPDNSVVCHANRLTGYEQDVFVSGSAMLVDTTEVSSFFPRIYNEDWIFMAPAIARGAVVEAGESRQLPYDPFADPEKAYHQEFGNVVADGLMSSLHQGGIELASQVLFWQQFLQRRQEFLEDIRERSDQVNARVVQALTAAERRLSAITVDQLIAYVAAWNSDRRAWTETLAMLPRQGDLLASVEHLGLKAYMFDGGPSRLSGER